MPTAYYKPCLPAIPHMSPITAAKPLTRLPTHPSPNKRRYFIASSVEYTFIFLPFWLHSGQIHKLGIHVSYLFHNTFYKLLSPWHLDNHFANFCQVITEEYCERFFMFGQLSENMEQIELRNDFWLYHFHCTLGFDWPYFQSVRKEKCCI